MGLRRVFALEDEAELVARRASTMDAAEGLDPDHLVRNIEIDIFAEADLERIGGVIGVAAPGEKAAFDPLAGDGITGPDFPGPASLADDVQSAVPFEPSMR